MKCLKDEYLYAFEAFRFYRNCSDFNHITSVIARVIDS